MALEASTTGSADAVHVRFRNVRDFEVDDVAQGVHVDAAGRNVGGHEHVDFALAESVHRAVPLRLALVAVNRFRLDARFVDVAHHLIGAVLRAGEHQRGFDFGPLEDFHEEIAFFLLACEEDLLMDGFCSGAHASHFHAHGIGQDGGRELRDAVGHRRREEQRLPLFWQQLDDLLDVVDEAHVEHGVGFIEDQMAELVEVDESLLDQIQQPTGRRHDDVHPPAQLVDLTVLGNPAKNDHRTQGRSLAVVDDVLVNLRSEFAGGGQNQRPHPPFFSGFRPFGQLVHNGQREGCGFSGSGLGHAQYITSRKNKGNGFALNGRGLGVTKRFEGIQHVCVESQFFK